MRRAAGIVLLVLLGLYLLTCFAQVRPGERAVVRRFGQVVAKPGPGLWIGLPWGFERVDRVPIDQVRRVAVGFVPDLPETEQIAPPGQLLTGDHNLVNLQVVIDYAVKDEEVEDYVVQSARVDGLVARAAEAAMSEWVAGHTVDDVLLLGKGRLPDFLVRQVQLHIDPYRLGIRIQAASVVHLLPPDEVKPYFDRVTSAQASILTQEHEARQEAMRLKRGAEGDKYRSEMLTAAYANERLRLAQTEADSFEKRRVQYHRLRKDNPHILASIWWDEMSRLFLRMRENGRIDLLDNYLGPDGLDITMFAPQPKAK